MPDWHQNYRSRSPESSVTIAESQKSPHFRASVTISGMTGHDPPEYPQTKEKIAQLRQQLRALDVVREQLKEQPDGQLSTTDPDARSMATGSKSSGAVAYNVQVAVDTKNHLIVAHEVTNATSDRAQLSPMAQAAREAMGKKELMAIADRGYFSGAQIKACADAGIAAVLPKPMTSNAKAEGRFDKADFFYIKQDDEYECPAGQRAIYRFRTYP